MKERDKRVPIQSFPPQISRTLVGVSVNPAHNVKAVVPEFQEKIAQYIARLATYPLFPSQILAGHNFFLLPSLRHMAPLLLLPVFESILKPLYQELLPRIKVNRHFPSAMVTAHPTVGGLGLGSMEYEQVAKEINLFLFLYHSPTPSAPSLRESL